MEMLKRNTPDVLVNPIMLERKPRLSAGKEVVVVANETELADTVVGVAVADVAVAVIGVTVVTVVAVTTVAVVAVVAVAVATVARVARVVASVSATLAVGVQSPDVRSRVFVFPPATHSRFPVDQPQPGTTQSTAQVITAQFVKEGTGGSVFGAVDIVVKVQLPDLSSLLVVFPPETH